MTVTEDKFDLGKTIGSIEASVSSIQSTINKVNNKVDRLGDRLSQLNHATVKRVECSDGCGKIERKLDSVTVRINGIKEELTKKQTKEVYPLGDGNRLRRPTSTNTNLQAILDEPQPETKNILSKLRENALTITAIIGMLTVVGVGFLKIARFVVRVETVLEENKKVTKAQAQTLKKEIRRIDEAKTRVVYVPINPDAGIPAATPSRRRRVRVRAARARRRARPAAAQPADSVN